MKLLRLVVCKTSFYLFLFTNYRWRCFNSSVAAPPADQFGITLFLLQGVFEKCLWNYLKVNVFYFELHRLTIHPGPLSPPTWPIQNTSSERPKKRSRPSSPNPGQPWERQVRAMPHHCSPTPGSSPPQRVTPGPPPTSSLLQRAVLWTLIPHPSLHRKGIQQDKRHLNTKFQPLLVVCLIYQVF